MSSTHLVRGFSWGLPVVLVVAVYLATAMAWPRTIPRLAVLPRPVAERAVAGCRTRHQQWVRDGLLWRQATSFSVKAPCGTNGI